MTRSIAIVAIQIAIGAIGLIVAARVGAARAEAASSSPPSVARFTPTGTVKQVRQVTARFSEAMVALGDPRDTAKPFDIDCPAKGSSRWIDSRNWSFDFEQDLPAGIRCTFKIRAGLKTLGGAAFTDLKQFSFETGGPAILESRPWPGNSDIDENQAFVLILDTEADEASIAEHTSFSVEGIAERVGITIMRGPDRELILKQFKEMVDKKPVVVVQARQRFPNSTKVTLVWGAGIRSKSGIATTQDQTFEYKSRRPFEATFQCERENARAGCIPLLNMTLNFSGAIAEVQAKQIVLIGPDGRRQYGTIAEPFDVRSVSFGGPFKESAQYRVEIPAHLIDDSGRSLSNESRFPLTVATDEFPPLAKFSARFGIIEQADPVLPVTVRNLEAALQGAHLKLGDATDSTGGGGGGLGWRELAARIGVRWWRVPEPKSGDVLTWLTRVARAKRAASVFASEESEAGSGAKNFTMPRPNGAKAFEVMGIPLKRPGLYVVELKSARLGSVLLGKPQAMYVPTAALVTNLAVHFKKGSANSLIWVTALESGRPVRGAEVAIANCHGDELWSGVTDSRGLAMVSGMAALDNPPRCENPGGDLDSDSYSAQTQAISGLGRGVLVTARVGDDFSFVHSSWQQGIEAWRYHLPMEYQESRYAHTVFDRTLLRAGETVHMKHFIRIKTLAGLSQAAPDDLPDMMRITFTGNDQHYDFDVKWSEAGTAENDWTIPHDAKLGSYAVALSRRKGVAPTPTPSPDSEDFSSNREIPTGGFNVEEFRIPLMKASVRMPAEPLVAVTEFPIDVSAQYLSGGAAKGLPVTVRSQINKDAYPSFADFEGFIFANGDVKTGIVHNDNWSEEEYGAVAGAGVHQRKDLTLDAAGGARTEVSAIPREKTPLGVHVELEYRDPNGESQTVSNNVTVWPARWLAGIQVEDWASSPKMLRVHLAVVDDSGKPVAHAPIRADVFSRTRYSYRKRLVGGFYSFENTLETKAAGALCAGVTDDHGKLYCEAAPTVTGEAVIQASVSDPSGSASSANSEIFIPGDQREQFAGRDDDRIDLLPEHPSYEPGESARLQVRMPFAEATALVTVEREGVLGASIVRLTGRNPVVTIPVRDWAPNVFISVLAVRGRIAGVQPTAMVDLGKPAFKLGIAEIRVGWREHRLKVAVTPEKSVYHVRDRARVKIAVRTFDDKPPRAGSAVAIAAIDEGLLELRANESWKLLDAMMGRRGYQVETSAGEMQVVGKRHYGLKAIPPGGGGGRQITRELFDTLLLWRASVALDANGDASIEVPLNDSITSFRIVAIADAGADQFGTGSASIRSTQDLMLFSGVSPIIRNGDSFAAEFTVRNASERALTTTVNAKVTGLNGAGEPTQTLALAPGEGKSITWNVAVPTGVKELKYQVDATVEHGPSDHLLIKQRVIPAVPVRAMQATLLRLEKPVEQPVARPAGAMPDVGGVQVALSPSLSAGLDGVREWMREYPYICLEQRVSRAIALGDPKLWGAVTADLPSYLDGEGLIKYFPSMAVGSDVLTAYVVAISHEAGLEIPPELEARMEKGLRDFVEGRISRVGVIQAADLPIRKLAAIDALASAGHAEPAMLANLTIEPNLWPDSAVLDWWAILLRVPQIPEREQRLKDAEQVMRSRLNQQGTGMHLSSDARNQMWWLMVAPDLNMVRLALVLVDNNLWHEDVPLVMRGALALQRRGAWQETVTNAWGTLAVNKFSRAFEATPLTGTSTASIQAASQTLDWSRDPQGASLGFAWPPAQANLKIAHAGTGNPWVEIRALAAVPLSEPFSSGYRITRTVTPIEDGKPIQGTGRKWKRGDLARVHLKIDAQADMTWVVIDDPIPAGASHVGGGFTRDSEIAASAGSFGGESAVWPAFAERAFDAYRAYYEYVPKGSFDVEYTIRLNQAGTFKLPESRVEALYQPEMFGELPNAAFEVAP